MSKTPRNTVKVRPGLPKVGDRINVSVLVTRTGRNTYDNGDTITVRVPGAPVPITVPAESLLDNEED